ncbi:MAG: hemerythrin domain-containing protein [Deltaproteobacteria bacterium]|nr:hemerythrin domain-containing protein [Deltaproteobacteria bacterium]
MRHPSLVPLSHDHHHGLALALRCRKQALGRLKPMGVRGLQERAQEVTAFVETNLKPHFQAEEEVLFPLMRSLAPESRPILDALLREHVQIREFVSRLDESSTLSKLLFDLGDLLERHIRKEERELFPLFESRVAPAEAEKLEAELKKILAVQDRK